MSDTTTKLTYLVGAKRLQEKNRDTEYLLSQSQLEMFESLVRIDEREKRDEAIALLRTIHMGNESARSQDIIRAAIHVLQRNAPEELAATIRTRGNT